MARLTITGEDVFYAQRLTSDAESSTVFIHGAGGTHRHWGHQIAGLSGTNLYAPDLPGHGRSGGQARTSVTSYAEFLSNLLEALGSTRATLVGHSMGGAIAQDLALNHASQVDRLILVGTGAKLRVLPTILEGLLNEFESTVDMILGYSYSEDAPQELVDLGRQEWLATTPGVLHGDFMACDHFDVRDRLREIRCPTLLICGEEDQLTPPKYSQFLQEQITDAQLTIIPKAGHMVMLEQPEEVSRAIAEFMKTTGA
ncbi:MAG: alpha/beta hydrolase [Chloroflexi bacterium B3_Chlor]|nr:MAG: alpha/beta hydrolase [Chloroflexi bacterium B3_Chlor]